MYRDIVAELFDFIEKSPSACHTVSTATGMLKSAGFKELNERDKWELKVGEKYFVSRSMTSIIAFTYPKEDFGAFSIIAPHGDSPCFKIKETPEIKAGGKYTKLNTEVYGGMALSLWLDRPLSAAGRVMVKADSAVEAKLVDFKRNLFVIPSLAIHMNREANTGQKMNPQVDMLPLYGGENADFMQLLANEIGVKKEDIISHEIYLYNPARGELFGESEEFIIAPKLDDLQSSFSALKAIISTNNTQNVNVCAVFDNEEIGSMTKQGADSTFLSDVLERISLCAGKTREDYLRAVANGFMVSSDNAHALHPNYMDKSDLTNKCYLNGGVVIKNSTRYATDALSSAIFKKICDNAEVPSQVYFNRSDVMGGSTLGNISNAHVSIKTVDIGAPQLSMHSPYETSGAHDTGYMTRVMQEFYSSVIEETGSGEYKITKSSISKEKTDNWQDISSK